MSIKTNDLVIEVATTNGSGSQSSNNILVRSIFRMGIPVSGKNLFPSNIQGLPTWFSIRANAQGFLSRSEQMDVFVAMNGDSIDADLKRIPAGTVVIYNDDLKFDRQSLREDLVYYPVGFRALSKELSSSPKLRKFLTNMVYVGVVAKFVGIDKTTLHQTVEHIFSDKKAVIEPNIKAIDVGWSYAEEKLGVAPVQLKSMNATNGQILIDGNSAAAIGLAQGGATFAAWYPITPSSSLMEKFISVTERRDQGATKTAVIQAEDELSSIAMVTGAGWAGARAFTATSGPGLSLMSECAGFNYFAEIPAVIWDVQRVGPSTGLPTRTMQGDVLSAHYLSHGDTRHPVLIPSSTLECYEFGQVALNLAEQLQSLVIVLSDLDLGMNFHLSPKFEAKRKEWNRGQVLTAEQLEAIDEFARYRDEDGDGICARTIPGTPNLKAGFFTRGTGHDELSGYSEDPNIFRKKLSRLDRKMDTAKSLMPEPEIISNNHRMGFLCYGSTRQAFEEIAADMDIDLCCVKSIPLQDSVGEFIRQHDMVFVAEQNRDGQMYELLLKRWPELHEKMQSVPLVGGQAVCAQEIRRSLEMSRG